MLGSVTNHDNCSIDDVFSAINIPAMANDYRGIRQKVLNTTAKNKNKVLYVNLWVDWI